MHCEINARTSLFKHQKAAVEKLLPLRVGALFMDMGTGKTRTALELFLNRQDKANRLVWICPVSIISTIRYEMMKHTTITPDRIGILCGDRKDTDIGQPFWIVGIESISSSTTVALKAASLISSKSMVVVDESTYIKGHRSIRSRRVTQYASQARYRLILTGTPITQGIEDLFSQFRFLSLQILGFASFFSFSRQHLVYSDRYRGLIRKRLGVDAVAMKIAPYTYQVTKEECYDLPPKVQSEIFFSLTANEKRIYQTVKDAALGLAYADIGDDASKLIFMLFNSLQQISSGFLRIPTMPECGRMTIQKQFWDAVCSALDSKESLSFANPSRRSAFSSLIDQLQPNEQAVLWAKFIADIDVIKAELESRAETFVEFTGRINRAKRDVAINDFRSQKARFFIATLDTGGHGIDLTCCNRTIFYNNSFKYSVRLQAEDRLHRLGQTSRVFISSLFDDTGIGQRIFNAIQTKGDALEILRSEIGRRKNPQSAVIKAMEEM